jgi:energy-coupling factor transporter transmembrane protein EcfT
MSSTRAKFEYEYRDTPIHRLHVVPKIVSILGLGGLFSAWLDPRFSVFLIAVALVIWNIAKVPRRWLLIPLLFVLGTQWATFFFSIPFVGHSYKVLPMEYATTTLFEVGYIPGVGHAVYTVGSMWVFLAGIIKYFGVVTLAFILYYTTNIADLVQVFIKAKLPNSIILVVIVIFRFFPVMTKLGSDAINALRLRGWKGGSRNPVKMVRSLVPLLSTIAREYFVAVNMVTLAVTNRAFGAYRMQAYKELPMKVGDWILTVGALVVFTVGYYLAITPPYYGNL